MKKSLVIMALLSLFAAVSAQNVDDALRYSQVFYGGTARFMSMGSAFTALGGDMSSLSQNPAGIGVFRSSEFSVSPQLFRINTKANFYGLSKDSKYNFNLNQIGVVSNLISNESGLISLNFGYSFNKTNNLNQSVRIQGNNTNSSMADYWANSNEGISYHDLGGAAGIAYDAWVIDTITGTGGRSYGTVFSNYGDNPPSVYGQNVRRLISNEGYTGEHALSIGGNYENKIFFGLTFGIHKINYTSHYEHLESTSQTLPSEFKNFTYTDHFENTGTGYSVKLGAIVKPTDALRIGFAFHSPTWYKINEYYYEDLSSNFTYQNGHYEYSNDPARYQYGLATPFRAMIGAAIQIKKIGLISADYEFADYSTARFYETGDNYDYTDKNNEIKNTLKATNNFRIGGELRLNQLYLRTGYGYYGKAFASGEDNENLDYSSVSFGIGFREKQVSLDLGFTSYMYDQKYFLYPLDNSYDPALARLNVAKNMFTLTLGYKFGY
ncbi:MAG TPA: outer membrane protein transport protein [Bacteroidales bacterium]|nr:outer membrane protein transport protein [Bacteroidales bacterium]